VDPNPGLLSGADAYETAGALLLLTSRLRQLCRQLAAILDDAGAGGTLTSPAGAPKLAAAELRQAGETLTAATSGWRPPTRRLARSAAGSAPTPRPCRRLCSASRSAALAWLQEHQGDEWRPRP
jgi:hypothetical protein